MMQFRRTPFWLFFGLLISLVNAPRVGAQEDAGDPPAAEKKEQKPVENPLKNALKRLLGGGKDDGPAGVELPKIEEGEPRAPSDPRIPSIREHEMVLENARARAEMGQWPEAIQIYQNLLDAPVDSVMRGDDGQYRSLRWDVQERIGSMPPGARETYERTYGGLAKKMLDDAFDASDMAVIREVAERFFHTKAGQAAANRIASLHVDRGEFAIAAQWYRRLAESGSELSQDPVWRFKAAAVFEKGGVKSPETEPFGQMPEADVKVLERRLPGKSLVEVREAWKSLTTFFNPPLDDWLHPGGAKNRSGHASGGHPLLISAWQKTTTEHSDVRDQVRSLQDDLEVSRTPAIPAMQPISVGSQVIFRTFDGLCVVDSETGYVQWESRETVPPSRLMTSGSKSSVHQQNFVIRGNVVTPYQGTQTENHPLANFLFRNGVHGTMTSDGSDVYVIEQNAVLSNLLGSSYYTNNSLEDNDPYRRDWGSNRLTAYDLKTGQQKWNVGGERLSGRLDSALAGTFFLGPPLADGGELFVMGEQDNAIRLYCLASGSGDVKWSCLLAYTDLPINQDAMRRWWPAQVALSDGVLVCPTSVGLLVGVDRAAAEVVWISSYKDSETNENKRQFRGGGYAPVSPGSLNDRWFPTPPQVVGQAIVMAPAESRMLAGFRLGDGEELWRIHDVEGGLYVAGAYEGQMLLVGRRELTAVEAATGNRLWSREYGDFDAVARSEGWLPSGRGIMLEGQLLLPMAGREIWYFDLEKNEFVGRAAIEEEEFRLGNLIMSQGRLISASAGEVAMFEPKADVEADVKQRLAADPSDFRALTRQAQILLLEKRFVDALTALRQIDEAALSGPEEGTYQRQMRQTLFQVVEAKETPSDAELEELKQYVVSRDDQERYLRLRARAASVARRYTEALETYGELSRLGGRKLVQDTTQPALEVREDVWLSARLRELWEKSTGEVSSRITAAVMDAGQRAMASGEIEAMRNVIAIYGFHPALEELYLMLAERAAEEQDYALAEYALDTLAAREDPSVRASALTAKIALLESFGLIEDAGFLASRLSDFDRELVMLDGSTVGEWVREFEQRVQPAAVPETSWGDYDYEVSHFGTSQWTQQTGTVNLEQSKLPFYRRHRFVYDQRRSRLEILRNDTDELVWSIPLQQADYMPTSNVLPVRVHGHLMTVYSQGMVQCYSLPDRELVWAQPVVRQAGNAGVVSPSKATIRSLQRAKSATSRFRMNQGRSQYGPLVLMTETTVCFRGRNELLAVDVVDGSIRWVRRGIPQEALIYGDNDRLCVVPPDLAETQVIDTRDGRALDVEGLETLLSEGIAFVDEVVVTVSERDPSDALAAELDDVGRSAAPVKRVMILEGRNLLSRESLWQIAVLEDDYLGMVDDRRVAIVRRNGSVELVDAASGESVVSAVDERLKRPHLNDVLAFTEENRLYVVLNHSNTHSTYLNIANHRVNGLVASIDVKQGEVAWVHETEKLNLVLEDLHQMPVLILAGTKHEQKHNLYLGMFYVQIIDKETGKVMLDRSILTQNQVQQISWQGSTHQIRLHAYNAIFTVKPKEDFARKEPPGVEVESD
ncbi:outer membrane protein assembly factor BamB family protein [Rubinisphaera margarita]|uniref:outer membrane protein assembly factor BamB family protein n=1 Tax=Rubinisphaera margarita TaxID=2909586 RepID=UPI001EE91D1C|nr:PQQ-binding-like beta-propeller repeat protein [Rubinisphaera margarita]MCG6154879.1 PQQ-like beta-propeller repeat protein [Rubinisphaera margarita]